MENYLKNHRYITIPAELFGTGLSMTALCIYGFLLQRYSLSCMNNRRDETGRVYIVYPIADLAKDVGRSRYTVMGAMDELEKMKLIQIRRREIKAVSTIYLNTPECGENSTLQRSSCRENSTSHVEKTQPPMLGKLNTNNRYNNRNNNNTPSQYSTAYTGYSTPSGRGRGGDRYRKGTDSGMFAPIPDYENCDYGYGY